MNKEKQRIAIAKACGYTDVNRLVIKNVNFKGDDRHFGIWSKQGWTPDYLNDLNAMHDAEKILTGSAWDKYLDNITTTASAADRAELFLKTLGLWEDDE